MWGYSKIKLHLYLLHTCIYLWATPTNQGTSNILDKMSFCYHCKEHTSSLTLITYHSHVHVLFFYFLKCECDHLCSRRKQFLWNKKWFWGRFLFSHQVIMVETTSDVFDLWVCSIKGMIFCRICLNISQEK